MDTPKVWSHQRRDSPSANSPSPSLGQKPIHECALRGFARRLLASCHFFFLQICENICIFFYRNFFCKYLHFILSCYMTPADPAAFLTVVCLVVLPLRIVVLQHLYCVACCLGCKRCVSLSKWNCPLFACPKSFWTNLRPVETNLQMFIRGLWSIHKSGNLNMKLGWGLWRPDIQRLSWRRFQRATFQKL